MQWLPDPDLNNAQYEDSGHFRNKIREYLKGKINKQPVRRRISENCIGASVT
jgi:hypothetical protein